MSKNKNDCDGKKCDDTAIPCYFAKQVIFSLKSEMEDLQEGLTEECDNSFYKGILVSLQVLHTFDSPVQAHEIIGAVGGLEKVESYAKKSGLSVDTDTIKWLKENY